MGVKIGNLNVSRKIKRIYVGVNGTARRVTKIYAKAKTSETSTKAGVVYKDDEILLVKARFSLGNTSPILCSVYKSETTGGFLVSGTFKDKFLLSEMSVSSSGTTVVDTGRSVSLGSSTRPFVAPTAIRTYGSAYVSDNAFLFSGAALGNVLVKRVSPYTMSEFDGSASFEIATSASVLASGQQDIPSAFVSSLTGWPLPVFMSINSAGASGIVASYSENGGSGKTYTFPTYKIAQRSVRCFDYESVLKKMIATNASTGKGVKILGIGAWFNNKDNSFNRIDLCGQYDLAMPESYSSENLYIGAGYLGAAVGSDGVKNSSAYMSTVSYQDGTHRYHKLIIDTGKGHSTDALNFDVKEYTDQQELPTDASRAAFHKWQILGGDSDYIYVLSTANDEVKILKFSTSAAAITKEAEYDTGIRLDANTVLQDVVPVPYARMYSEAEGKSFIPAFVITKNNTYAELVIVPRAIIKNKE